MTPNEDRAGTKRVGLAVVAVAAALGVVHALVVAHRYHVGSFDDDASYVLAARALASGHGITSRLAGGYPLVGVYPPGYPALLSPLAAIWPSGDLAFRALSLVLFVSIFPLTWVYLGRRRVPGLVQIAVLALLALNPVLATYATMVMPETAFVVVFLLMLLAVDRWQLQPRSLTWAGVAGVVAAAGLLWMKEAGVGLVIGVVLWLVLHRMFRKALLAATAPVVLFLPVMVVRARAGADLIGSRYSGDLGGSFRGGLGATLRHLVPSALKTYFTHALPHAIVPNENGLLPTHGVVGAMSLVVAATVTPLVVLGFVMWCRRHADVACLAVPVYLAETLVYPFINERRVVLILPVIVAWYALGAATVFALVRRSAFGDGDTGGRLGGGLGGRLRPILGTGVPVVTMLLVVVVLSGQFTRDYLYFEGADSSAPGGSPYMAFLHQAGSPADVVETDYLWTTTLYGGHRTANGAYLAGCDTPPVVDAIRADGAGYLLTASLNGSGPVDDGCLLPVLGGLPGAIRLYRSPRDQSSVFELVGPGTGHPGLRDLVGDATLDSGGQPVVEADEAPQAPGDPAGRFPTVAAANGSVVLTWSWKAPVAISQISLGGVGAVGGVATTAASAASRAAAVNLAARVTSVQVTVRRPDGSWKVVAGAPGAVGSGTAVPFLLVDLPQAEAVTSIRVTVGVTAAGTAGVHDFHVLGPSP